MHLYYSSTTTGQPLQELKKKKNFMYLNKKIKKWFYKMVSANISVHDPCVQYDILPNVTLY